MLNFLLKEEFIYNLGDLMVRLVLKPTTERTSKDQFNSDIFHDDRD